MDGSNGGAPRRHQVARYLDARTIHRRLVPSTERIPMSKVNFEVVAGQQAPLKLSKAILIYQGDAETTFATVHDVAIQGNTPVILEGKSMTAEAAVRLATEL